ncbi:MAG: hypothetical protein V4719_07160 [Planctomycetota bacterium]
MTFTAVWLWTLLRSLVLMTIALPGSGLLVRWLRTSPPRWRGWQLALLMLPILFPLLLTGYAYSQMTRLLITGWWPRELWFDLLLLLRVIPIGTLLWYYSPPSPLSREAWHARVLALRSDEPVWRRLGVLCWYWVQGPARAGLFAASGLFLVLFSEFELASLLATTSWTVWLFDAQAGGLPLSESLKCCVGPACCTWLACGTLPWMFATQPLRSAGHSANQARLSMAGRAGCWSYLAVTWGLLVIYPSVLIGREALPGVGALFSNGVQARGLAQGILIAAGSALISGVAADLLAGLLLSCARQRPNWLRVVILASGVGLCGSLIISLVVVACFQSSWLRPLYDTPLPLLLGLVVWLLPRAILLQGMLQSIRSPIAEHAARLLLTNAGPRSTAARNILWHIQGRPAIAVRLLLCHWAYWELTLPDVLAPAGLVAAPVRLYIDMHFGRNAMLTAKAGLTLAAPLLLVAVCWPWLKKSAT